MRLIVAEKPSVARDIAKVLGIQGRGQGTLGRGDVQVTWCVGHLVELAQPAAHNDEWKSWRLESLPMLPKEFKLSPRSSSLDQWQVVRELLRRPDLEEVVNACDAGREGELIFAYTYDLAGCKAPVKRLWISSMTDSAIRQGFDSLRPGDELRTLADAARCRSEADWLVGLNATRAMTTRYRRGGRDGPLLSVGRVQTPTLALLVRREEEIEAFEPRSFWQVRVTFEAAPDEANEPRGTYQATWQRPGKVANKEDVDRLYDKAEAEAVVARIADQDGLVHSVKRKQAKEKPPLLYDLTSLQKEANKRFGYTAARTLEIAQALYEKHKVLTYPRTDSRHLSQDQVDTLPRALGGVNFGPYASFAQKTLDRWPAKLTKRVVDDNEVSDHHAIIPTGEDPRRANLSVEEKRLFDLVARRFLAVFEPDAVFATVVIDTRIGKDRFMARGRTCLETGWRAIDPPLSKKKELLLPPVEKGEVVTQAKHGLHEGKTKPPRRYTEATLLAAMERASDALEDAELKRAMKRNGLGTPATRASIIETLLRRRYVVRKAKDLVATPQGRTLLNAIPVEVLTSARLTGAWEARLVALAEGGEETRDKFMHDVRRFTAQVVRAVQEASPDEAVAQKLAPPPPDGEVLGTCPQCAKEVREGRRGWGCVGCDVFVPSRMASRDVSKTMARQLLKEGQTKAVKGFKSKKGKDFEASLVLKPDGSVTFAFPDPEPLGACPGCAQPVRQRGKIVTCDSGRACSFVVFEDMGGMPVTEDDVKRLLAGELGRLEWQNGRVVAVQRDPRQLAGAVGPCPQCGTEVHFRNQRWSCLSCRFGLDAELGGRPFAPEEMHALLTQRRTPRLHGFRQKGGAVFKAAVVLTTDNRMQWDYTKPADETDPDEKACPVCVGKAEPYPGHVIRGRAAWGCSRWREGCVFRVPFVIRGRPLAEDEFARLISKSRATRYVKGFEGLERTARVVLVDADPCWTLEERKAKKASA